MKRANAETAATTAGALLLYYAAQKLGKDVVIKAAVTSFVAPLAPAAATLTIATVSFGSTAYAVFQAGKWATDIYTAKTYTAQINAIKASINKLRAEQLDLSADIQKHRQNIRELIERKAKLLEKTNILSSAIENLIKQNDKLTEQCEQSKQQITALNDAIEKLPLPKIKQSASLNHNSG